MKVKKCKNCGKILKIKKIKKSGHRLRTQIEKMPTCTKPGLTATYCLNPDCIYGYRKYYKTEKIAPLGHSYIDKTYKATCTAPKTIVTSCKNCKYKSTHKEGKALVLLFLVSFHLCFVLGITFSSNTFLHLTQSCFFLPV